jgi:CTP:molybdopterin cytidylyltransferase MocA
MTRILTIVLAAGRGERIGGPKALLAWPSRGGTLPLAAAHVAARTESDRVLVVTRADIADALARHAPSAFGPDARGQLVISHAADALGPAGSIAAAAAAIDEPEALLLLTPVDTPPVADDTIRRLLAALDDPAAMAAKPRHLGRGGHPIVARAPLLDRYRAAEPIPLRDALCALGDALRSVDVDDPSIHADIDDRAALRSSLIARGLSPHEPTFFD